MLFFTTSGIYEKFADAFVKACEGLKVGNGFEKGVSLVILLSLSFRFSQVFIFCQCIQDDALQ